MQPALPQDVLAELAQALATGAVLVVPNHRSSQQLQEAWGRRQSRQLNTPVLRVPAIRAVDLWLKELWQQLALQHESPIFGWHLLEPAEELLLWRQVLAAAPSAAGLLNHEGTAATARDTWRELQLHMIGTSDLRGALQLKNLPGALPDDRAIWFEWLQAFTTLCKKRRVLTLGDMLQMLLAWTRDAPDTVRSVLPSRILLWGFDSPPPLYAALFEGFNTLGARVAASPGVSHAPACQGRVFADGADECRAAADWARATLLAQPDASIGIICPDPRTLQGLLARALSQAFGAEHPALPALPHAVAEQPFVATALQLLALNQTVCDTLALCRLLRSPWLRGESAEADARARLEQRLRRQGELQTTLADLRKQCLDADNPAYSPLLGTALLHSEEARRRHKDKQPVAAWLDLFKQQWRLLLDEERLHTSGDRIQLQAWQLLLDKSAQSAFIAEPCTLAAARSFLATLARETTTPGASGASRVQLLGPVASAGLHFTHLWSMQMCEQHWPGDSHPNPWLPLDLQKSHNLPGADPPQTLLLAQRSLTALIAATSTELVFSHALLADGLPQRPSRLLPEAASSVHAVSPAHHPASLHPAVQALGTGHAKPEHDLLQLPVALAAQGPGALLADQARCPFRAFAIHRLKAGELQALGYGLSPAAVGQMVHRALEYFWQTLRDSRQLLATEATALQALLDDAIRNALRDAARHYPHTMTPRYQSVQHTHLLRLLTAWIEQERRRGHFTVLDNEESLQWRFQQLELRLRIDRIDRSDDGSTVLVDYKTGKLASMDWQDERQQDTQLLLYQQAIEQSGRYPDVSALLYARVNLEEVTYSGIGADDSVLPGIAFSGKRGVDSPGWDALKAHWQQTLQQLAQEFLDGHAGVQPKTARSCDNCHLHAFCRVAETGSAA